jgi:hypothetical protein
MKTALAVDKANDPVHIQPFLLIVRSHHIFTVTMPEKHHDE